MSFLEKQKPVLIEDIIGSKNTRVKFSLPVEVANHFRDLAFKESLRKDRRTRGEQSRRKIPEGIEAVTAKDFQNALKVADEDVFIKNVFVNLSERQVNYLSRIPALGYDAFSRAVARGRRMFIEDAFRKAQSKDPRFKKPSLVERLRNLPKAIK